MFRELDAYLSSFMGHEERRYKLLQAMTPEEREQAFLADERFMWHDAEQIGNSDGDATRVLSRQELMIVKNKRFIHCMKHRHIYIELQYVYSGSLRNRIEGQIVQVREGEILLMDASVEHEIFPAGKEDIGINIIMHREFFDSKFRDMLAYNDFIARLVVDSLYAKKEEKKYILFSCGEERRVQMAMKLLLDEWRQKESGYATALQGYMLAVFTYLMRNCKEKDNIPTSDMKKLFMKELHEYLAKNYRTADLKSTAAYFNFNQDYLSRLIKKQIGVSFISLLQDIKLEQGRIMLTNTDLSVDEIADQLGYGDVSYFYKVFRKKYQKTPGEFRKNM